MTRCSLISLLRVLTQVEDALAYLEKVKIRFADQPRVYNQFLEIMKEFKAKTIDTNKVIHRVSQLFRGHTELILSFSTFLPPGFTIQEMCDDPITGQTTTAYTGPQGYTTTVPTGPSIMSPPSAGAGPAPARSAATMPTQQRISPGKVTSMGGRYDGAVETSHFGTGSSLQVRKYKLNANGARSLSVQCFGLVVHHLAPLVHVSTFPNLSTERSRQVAPCRQRRSVGMVHRDCLCHR